MYVITVTFFTHLQFWSQMQRETLRSLINSNFIGNRNRFLSACSSSPQTTELPSVPALGNRYVDVLRTAIIQNGNFLDCDIETYRRFRVTCCSQIEG